MVGKLTTLSGGNGSNYPRCINLPGRIRVGGRRGRLIRLAVNFPPPRVSIIRKGKRGDTRGKRERVEEEEEEERGGKEGGWRILRLFRNNNVWYNVDRSHK